MNSSGLTESGESEKVLLLMESGARLHTTAYVRWDFIDNVITSFAYIVTTMRLVAEKSKKELKKKGKFILFLGDNKWVLWDSYKCLYILSVFIIALGNLAK